MILTAKYTHEEDYMAEALQGSVPKSILDDFGLQKAVPMTIKELRLLDSTQKKTWFGTTLKEMSSLFDKQNLHTNDITRGT